MRFSNTFWSWISKRSPAAKHELLHDVVLALRDRDCVIEAQRSERRLPDQADTDGGADHIGIIVYHSARTRNAVDQTVDFTRGRPRGRPLIVPKSSRIRIDSAFKSDFLRQEPE